VHRPDCAAALRPARLRRPCRSSRFHAHRPPRAMATRSWFSVVVQRPSSRHLRAEPGFRVGHPDVGQDYRVEFGLAGDDSGEAAGIRHSGSVMSRMTVGQALMLGNRGVGPCDQDARWYFCDDRPSRTCHVDNQWGPLNQHRDRRWKTPPRGPARGLAEQLASRSARR